MEIPDPTPVILLVPTGDAENPSFLLLLLKISLLTFCLFILMSVAGCRLKSPVWLESHRLQPLYTLPGLCARMRAWALRMQGIPGEKWAVVAGLPQPMVSLGSESKKREKEKVQG